MHSNCEQLDLFKSMNVRLKEIGFSDKYINYPYYVYINCCAFKIHFLSAIREILTSYVCMIDKYVLHYVY